MNICNVCGLPGDLCVCDTISTEQRKVFVVEKHIKGPMFVTTVAGIESDRNLEQVAKELKRALACGGTVKNKTIFLQGRHRKKVIQFFLKKGYANEQIS